MFLVFYSSVWKSFKNWLFRKFNEMIGVSVSIRYLKSDFEWVQFYKAVDLQHVTLLKKWLSYKKFPITDDFKNDCIF